jgi:hypothetical protein
MAVYSAINAKLRLGTGAVADLAAVVSCEAELERTVIESSQSDAKSRSHVFGQASVRGSATITFNTADHSIIAAHIAGATAALNAEIRWTTSGDVWTGTLMFSRLRPRWEKDGLVLADVDFVSTGSFSINGTATG